MATARAGNRRYPPPGLLLPGPYCVYLSRRNQPLIPVSCDVPELPDSSAEPEPTCRKRSDSDCVVLCVCVLVKGTSSSSLGALPACLCMGWRAAVSGGYVSVSSGAGGLFSLGKGLAGVRITVVVAMRLQFLRVLVKKKLVPGFRT